MDTPGPIRILVVDDHSMFREGLVATLNREAGFEVCEAGSVAGALVQLDAAPCDVLLLDYDLGNERGTDLLDRLDRMTFDGLVVILTGFVGAIPDDVTRRYDVDGIISKAHSVEWLAGKLRELQEGGSYFDPDTHSAFDDSLSGWRPISEWDVRLTARERDTLRHIMNGCTNKEIAAIYRITESGVKRTVQRLFRKTAAHTRSQLVRIALEHGLDREP